MNAALNVPAPWYAGALRRAGALLLAAAERLERRPLPPEPLAPWSDPSAPEERVFELRNRILNGFY